MLHEVGVLFDWSNNSLRRWQIVLAALCQAVSSVATVRLTWTKTWLLPKLRAEGRLPKLVQLATPVTGWWMLFEERRMCLSEGSDSEFNRKSREKPRQIWLGIVGVLAEIRAATSRPHSPQPIRKVPPPHTFARPSGLYHWLWEARSFTTGVATNGVRLVRTVLNVDQVVQTFKDEQTKLRFYMLNARSNFFSSSVATSQKTLNIYCKYVLLIAAQGNKRCLDWDDMQGVCKM